MTFEELKAEATRQGYYLIKMKERVNLLDCTCGGKRRTHWSKIKDNQCFAGLQCIKCGRKVWGKDTLDARKKWNEAILAELENADR